MAIYLRENLKGLLKDKYVLLLGDSVQRSVYKDLVVLCHDNRFMAQSELRQKGEESFLDDKLIFRSELTNGTQYREVREFKKHGFHIKFHFLTRVYNDYMESILKDFGDEKNPYPDVLVLNSCLWDISRYGTNSMEKYKENLEKLCKRLEAVLPTKTLVIWRTALPVSEDMKGGFLTAEAEWCRNMLKLDILRGNYFAYNIVSRYNYDVLDMHYHFRFQLHRRASDGVHWNMYAHRRMTNILLTHISQAWNKELPELPWADNSRIEFATDEIEMNTTNVLKQAYEPNPLLRRPFRPLLRTPTESKIRTASNRGHTQEYYSSFYSVPPEEEYEVSAFNENYQFLHQEPIFDRCHRIPTAPYPDVQPQYPIPGICRRPMLELSSNIGAGPVRRAKKWSSRNTGYQRGRASEMLKKRIQKEREQQRMLTVPPSRYLHDRYQDSSSKHRSHWNSSSRIPRLHVDSIENHWSQFSRHNPRYDSYDDSFHEDTTF